MKKKLLLSLFAVLCVLISLSSCKDDKEEVAPTPPPTVEDIIAEYSADNLKLSIEGVDVTAEDVKIELAKSEASEKVTVILYNVVPGSPVFRIPDTEFAVTTRSAYVSTLAGKVHDDVAGYDVKVDGTVEDKVLTAKIVVAEIPGEDVVTASLYNLIYKGNMDIDVANIPNPISMEQRVYVAKAYSKGMEGRDLSMVKLTIQNFAFQGLTLGDITLDTVLVQKRGEVLAFKANDRKLKLAAVGEVLANLRGTIVGEKMTLNLDIDATGLKVAVGFEGQSVIESKVARITEMAVEGDAIIGRIASTSNMTLQVWDDTEDGALLLVPKYKLSDKATVDSVVLFRKGQPSMKLTQDQVESKQPIDFSLLKQGKNDYVKYFLAAEDPNTKGSYIIYVERIQTLNTDFSFNQWISGEPAGWATSNSAAALFPLFGINVPVPVLQVPGEDAAKITTSRTVSETIPNGMIPGVTSGTMFLGTFAINAENTLKSTRFGLPYRKVPVTFKMTYKYIPGTTFYRTVTDNSINGTEIVPGEKDQCSIGAYLYEVADFTETLDGTNINTDNRVILKAIMTDNATDGYKTQTINFVKTGNGEFNPAKKYKLAVVCSSSKRGDEFMGADGSQLFVQKLVIE